MPACCGLTVMKLDMFVMTLTKCFLGSDGLFTGILLQRDLLSSFGWKILHRFLAGMRDVLLASDIIDYVTCQKYIPQRHQGNCGENAVMGTTFTVIPQGQGHVSRGLPWGWGAMPAVIPL